MKYYSTVKKDELMKFASKWMELEEIMMSEIYQIKKEMLYVLLALNIQFDVIKQKQKLTTSTNTKEDKPEEAEEDPQTAETKELCQQLYKKKKGLRKVLKGREEHNRE